MWSVARAPRKGCATSPATPWRGVATAAVCLASLLGCGAVLPTVAGGAEPGGWEAAVGFEGVYRTGSWTPLLLTPATAARVWVEDPDGELVGYPPVVDTTGQGGADAPRRFRVRFGRPAGRVIVEDDRGVQTPLRLPVPLESTDAVMLVIGDLPSAERAARLMQREDGGRYRVVTIADASGLGPAGIDLDGADAIVVCGSAVPLAPPAALAGVDDWVRSGGRLVFLAGMSAALLGRSRMWPTLASTS